MKWESEEERAERSGATISLAAGASQSIVFIAGLKFRGRKLSLLIAVSGLTGRFQA